MKLITRFELAKKNDSELKALYREIFNSLASYKHGNMERMNALATLSNIQRELSSRTLCL